MHRLTGAQPGIQRWRNEDNYRICELADIVKQHPRYWSEAVKNGSSKFNYYAASSMIATSRRA